MKNRQKLLLGLISYLEGKNRNSRLDLVKFMFLLSEECSLPFVGYSFHPYKYGPWSASMYSDLNFFEQKGFIAQPGNNCTVTAEGKTLGRIPSHIISYLDRILDRFPQTESMIDMIYDRYPEYAIKSERKNAPKPANVDDTPSFFLIGYEGLDIDSFLYVLIQNNVQILVDVRNNPRSMKFEFNKGRLEKFLANIGIKYVGIPELGIESENRKGLQTREEYEVLFDTYRQDLVNKEQYVEKLIGIGKTSRVALMCFESDYKSCHRREIGEILQQRGYEVHPI